MCFKQRGMMGEAMGKICHDHRGLHANVSTAPRYLLKIEQDDVTV